MMILVYTESENGLFKKKAYEALSYARALAQTEGQTKIVALTINADNPEELQTYGADVIISVKNNLLKEFNAKAYLSVLEQVIEQEKPNTVLMSASANTRYIAPMLAAKLGFSFLSNVNALPKDGAFKKTVFSSKANAWFSVQGSKVLTIANNIIEVTENQAVATLKIVEPILPETLFDLSVIETKKVSTKISIADASIVVAGGRGMQTPENWQLIENLADTLGAATACTKPVSDMGWRPHSEHVGQTGKPVACDLYIAIGISGAIQHVAGINPSKVKLVINSDPEAPFFKVADYGIVGDLFEILPKLTEKIKSVTS